MIEKSLWSAGITGEKVRLVQLEYIDSDHPLLVILDDKEPHRYYGQVGGIGCDHPLLQGRYEELPESFGKVCDLTCAMACFGKLKPEHVSDLLLNWPEGASVKLDESRITDGTEAYLPVIVKETGEIGWLVLPDNCD